MKRVQGLLFLVLLLAAGFTFAADDTDTPPVRTTLAQDHECERVLRNFMAKLTEKDFDPGVTGLLDLKVKYDTDPEYLYRNVMYDATRQPLIGAKDSLPMVQIRSEQFLLSNIERADGIYLPPVWPETLMSFVQWDYPGNPYHNNRGLKLRAFAGAVVQMTEFLKFAEENDGKSPPPIRPDWHGYNPVIWAAPYPGFKDVLPAEVQQAYEACLKLAGERILSWPVRGETCETNLLAPLGLVYIARALNDKQFSQKVEAYVRPVFTEERFFHTAGYWNERGGIDTGFGGMSNLYGAWIGLMTDWPFVKEALDRTYRLRKHLILPEPDGKSTGPSHFNSRLGSPANRDQYGYAREITASMITDEAACFVRTPSAERLAGAPAAKAKEFNRQLMLTAKTHLDYYTQEDLKRDFMRKWSLRVWMTYRFPISVNPAYEFYHQGAYAHRLALEKADSPLLKAPFLSGENFVRTFGKDFVVVRQPSFAAIVHTGPVGVQTPDDMKTQFPGPMGLGGGQLSAFWTPETGPTLLGLRSGMTYHESYDDLDDWETWPIHAVTGIANRKQIFTSARIAKPNVVTDLNDQGGTVTVSGQLVVMKTVRNPSDLEQVMMYDDALKGKLEYTRTFTFDKQGVRVQTQVVGDGKDKLDELYETIPVYFGAGQQQKTKAAVKIEFKMRGKWHLATENASSITVEAIRVTRFGKAILVTFDKPRTVKISPADWTDQYINKFATCRNIMIDLRDGAFVPVSSEGTRGAAYLITPVDEPAE